MCFRGYAANDAAIVRHAKIESSDFMQYAVPGFVFFAQNNLGFLALQHMNSSAFQLLMNTRIVSVAVMSVVVLKKPMHALEWCSIVLLMVGAMQYQLSGCDDSGYRIDVEGLSVMAVIVFCAAAGNVYTQRVMQRKMDQPLMVQNAMLYVWGVLFNGVNWFASVVPRPEHHGPPVPLFGAIGAVEVLSMVFYAVYGLSISIILKLGVSVDAGAIGKLELAFVVGHKLHGLLHQAAQAAGVRVDVRVIQALVGQLDLGDFLLPVRLPGVNDSCSSVGLEQHPVEIHHGQERGESQLPGLQDVISPPLPA